MVDISHKNQEKILPIAWSGWDDIDTFGIQFYDATFISDFGPVKEGETFTSVYVDLDEGIMEIYADDPDGCPIVIHTIELKLVPA